MTLCLRVLALLALAVCAVDAGAVQVRDDLWVTNGTVRAVVTDADHTTLYIGGDFTYVGPPTGAAVGVDAATGVPDTGFPRVNGPVYAAVPDGSGGWYIGGAFSQVGNQTLPNLAHINNDNTVDTWAPGPDGAVRALVLDTANNLVYAGGDFTTVNGSVTRNRLAALSTADGSATGWDPDANGAVRALVLSGTTLYAGGDFTDVGGVTRYHAAAFDTTGADLPISWDPRAGDPVYTLRESGGVVLTGGAFTSVGGELRGHLAALDLDTGEATGWDPAANATVRVLRLSGDGGTLYAGGDFTGVGGQVRNRIAELSTSTGMPTQWNPSANGPVYALEPSGSGNSFYVAGQFTVIGGQPRQWIAEITTFNGAATAWDPQVGTGTGVFALVAIGDVLFLGGDFESVESEQRYRVAAINLAAEAPTPFAWAPQIDNGSVRTLRFSPDGSRLYAGGDFTSVAGAGRIGIVALDPTADAPFNWNPQANGPVLTIVPSLDRTLLYVGGGFTSIGLQLRFGLAALDPVDGTADGSWVVTADGAAGVLHAFNDTGTNEFVLYAGGAFDRIDNAPRGHLVALDALPPEAQPPVTTATPAGGTYNDENNDPVVLSCDDGAGSGCAVTYYTTDGTDPTTASDQYDSPIGLQSDMVLKYFSVDNAGNAEAIRTETYVVEAQDPVTTASPTTQVFESDEIEIRLSCSDAGSLGCVATYYTVDGSTPTTASPRYTGPITITDTTVLKFFSVDGAGNIESIQREEYVSNRGEIGALSAWELGAALLALILGAGRRGRRR